MLVRLRKNTIYMTKSVVQVYELPLPWVFPATIDSTAMIRVIFLIVHKVQNVESRRVCRKARTRDDKPALGDCSSQDLCDENSRTT